MTDGELRAGVVKALETATMDLTVGRYGDPHVGFLVLVAPDSEPTIVALTPRTAQSMKTVSITRASESPKTQTRGRFFTIDELKEAWYAIGDIVHAFQEAAYSKEPPNIQARIRRGWENRREAPLRQAMAAAEAERKRPAKCPSCGRRFTERGLDMHKARSRYCSQRLHAGQEDGGGEQ